MVALLPPLFFVLSWVFAMLGWDAVGAESDPPFDENALRWLLFLAVGWTGIGGSVSHIIFAKQTARSIGWQTNGFQYEVGFANLAIGLAALYAAYQDERAAWATASIAAGVFLGLAGINHVIEMFRERNFKPGNSVILVSDFGIPISLVALLIATRST